MGWRDAPTIQSKPAPDVGAKESWRSAPIASVPADIVASVPSALGRVPFVIGGALGDAMGMGMEAGRWADSMIGSDPVETAEEVAARNPLRQITSSALENAYESATGTQMYEPQTAPGRVASTAMTGGGAGLLVGGIPGVVMGAGGGAGGELARQKTEGTKWEFPASILGAIGGTVAGRGAQIAGRRAITPRNIPKENWNAAKNLRKEGIRDLTEGQITRSNSLLAAERQRMGIRGDARRISQFEDLTEAALKKAGIDARRATPEVMDEAFNRFDQEYRALSSRNTLVPDQDFAQDVGDAARFYAGRVSAPNRAPLIGNYLQEVQGALKSNGGVVPGETYQSLRSRIQADARSMADPDAKRTLFDLAEALDAAMERSIVKNNPSDAGAFRDIRRRYRNILVVEDAVGKGSSEANLGLVTGAALENATRRIQGKRNFVRGKGDYAELSRAAGALMRELPMTGAAPVAPSSLFSALKSGIGMLRMAPPVQRFLTNRLMPPPPPPPKGLLPNIPGQRALLNAVPGANMATQSPYRTGGRF